MVRFLTDAFGKGVLILATVFACNTLSAIHASEFRRQFEACKTDLMAAGEYHNLDQALDCAASKWQVRVLGTLVAAEGSYLEGVRL